MPQLRGLGQDTSLVRPTPEAVMPVAVAPTVKEIPYDYVAKFTLQGRPGNRVPQVINISTEGAFVAVAIGYSFIPAKLQALDETRRGKITTALKILPPQPIGDLVPEVLEDPRMLLQCLLVWLCGIDFKYSIIDSGTGRELQNLAIHNIAGLGKADGDRPFRPLAKPMLFMPRSTIRIEVEEISEGPIYGYDHPVTSQRVGAELFIVLHGYKILGYGMTP